MLLNFYISLMNKYFEWDSSNLIGNAKFQADKNIERCKKKLVKHSINKPYWLFFFITPLVNAAKPINQCT